VRVIPYRPVEDDPRFTVPLPWTEIGAELLELHGLAVALAHGLALLVIPGALIRWSTRRRLWSLRFLLTLPVITGIALLTYRLSRRYLIWNPSFTTAQFLYNFVGLTVAGVCVFAFFRQILRSAAQRRWWTFGITLGIPLLHVTFLFCMVMVGLDPPLRYEWDKWYSMPLAAIYNMGFLILCWIILRAFGLGLWRAALWLWVFCRP
jgi:hypothetical protein